MLLKPYAVKNHKTKANRILTSLPSDSTVNRKVGSFPLKIGCVMKRRTTTRE